MMGSQAKNDTEVIRWNGSVIVPGVFVTALNTVTTCPCCHPIPVTIVKGAILSLGAAAAHYAKYSLDQKELVTMECIGIGALSGAFIGAGLAGVYDLVLNKNFGLKAGAIGGGLFMSITSGIVAAHSDSFLTLAHDYYIEASDTLHDYAFSFGAMALCGAIALAPMSFY